MRDRHSLETIYARLYAAYGPRNWWPGRTRFEIILGAILTQNVTWRNAKKCINNLKSKGLLNSKKLHRQSIDRIAALIVPSRYYNQKAAKIKNFLAYLYANHDGSLTKMFKIPMNVLREELLAIKGIGKETADCILLYAGEMPSFVSDAYTHRFLARYGILDGKIDYDRSRSYFMDNIPQDTHLYNEFHALIVNLGYHHCKAKPVCAACPVRRIDKKLSCAFGKSNE